MKFALYLSILCWLFTACRPVTEENRAEGGRTRPSPATPQPLGERLVLMAWNAEFLWDG
ncbi:MAG: hypothetical protein GY953_11585, partial [bacterium]|nr:hypothetical protein [bacterium]